MSISVELSNRPKISVYKNTVPSENTLDNSIVEVDGGVKVIKEKIFATFDHHRSGELINLDTVPNIIDSLENKEIATHLLDSDFIISSAVILAGGKSQIYPEMLRILESASRYCDYLSDTIEEDKILRTKGLGLHLYLKNEGFKLTTQLANIRNEIKKLPNGKFIPNPSDSTKSEVADKLLYDILGTIVSDDINKINNKLDYSYLSKRDEFLKKAAEDCIRNDDNITVIKTTEYIDPLFIYEDSFVKGKVLVLVNEQSNGTKYSIGMNPFKADLDFTDLINRLNEIDPNIFNQEIEEGKKPDTWGGRTTVFGSPFRINSGLDLDEVEEEIKNFLYNINRKKLTINDTFILDVNKKNILKKLNGIEKIIGENYILKDEFHITLIDFQLGKKISNICKGNPSLKIEIEELLNNYDFSFELYDENEVHFISKYYDYIETWTQEKKHIKENRTSLILKISSKGIIEFSKKLGELLGEKVDLFPHITIATNSDNESGKKSGIAIKGKDDFEKIFIGSVKF